MTGLVGWWPLNEDSGSTAYDLSGNGNHGGLNGGVTQGVAGKGGLTAYSFDGNDDYLEVGDETSLDFGSSNFSVNIWFKTNTGSGVLSHKIGGGGGGSLGFVCDIGNFASASAGQLTFRVRDGNNRDAIRTEQSFDDGNWYLATFVRSGSGATNLDIYVDGEKISTKIDTNQNAGDITSSHPYQIGAQQNEDRFYFKGLIANNSIYDRALTPEEVQKLYKWGSGDYTTRSLSDGSDSGAVSRWKFDSSADDFWGTNNGTLSGASLANDSIRGKSVSVTSNNTTNFGNTILNGLSSATVSYWMKWGGSQPQANPPRTPDKQNVFTGQPSKNGNTRVVFTDSNSTGFQLNGGEAPVDDWYHVVSTYDSSESILYINGSRTDSTETDGNNLNSNSNKLMLGNDATGANGFRGKIDDLRIFDRALSPSEVFELYQWGTRGRDLRKLTVNSRGL